MCFIDINTDGVQEILVGKTNRKVFRASNNHTIIQSVSNGKDVIVNDLLYILNCALF